MLNSLGLWLVQFMNASTLAASDQAALRRGGRYGDRVNAKGAKGAKRAKRTKRVFRVS